MDVKAHARYIHMSPKKVRFVVESVRGLSVERSLQQLQLASRRAAEPVRKVIESAAANAEHNHQLQRSDLYVKEIYVNEGPTIKRFQPRAFGRAAMIRKRMSHISVVVGTRTASETVATKQKSKVTTNRSVSTAAKQSVKKTAKKTISQ